jgi:AmiR/NasT family two-component response regulator
MTVNENGNVNVESLKNSDNMEKQQETQTGTLSKNEVLENARKILMEKGNIYLIMQMQIPIL